MERESVDEFWCLGDTVGYGPRPNDCCETVQSRAEQSLVGNHDLVVLGELRVSDFNDEAAAAATWTSSVLTEESRTFLAGLEPFATRDGVELFHASARDPVWEYVLSDEAAAVTLELAGAPLVLVGHSHVALQVALREERLTGGLAPAGSELELDGERALLNPGSVGQPRDGDPRAAYAIADIKARRVELFRIEYAVNDAQAKVLKAGLPRVLAQRLGVGR